MFRSPKRHPRHRPSSALAAITGLTAAALAVDHAVRTAPAVRRGAKDVLTATAIGAAILAAAAMLVVITWAALRRGRRRAWQQRDEAPGRTRPAPGPDMTAPEPERAVWPAPQRRPGPPLFINGPVSRRSTARAPADQDTAR